MYFTYFKHSFVQRSCFYLIGYHYCTEAQRWPGGKQSGKITCTILYGEAFFNYYFAVWRCGVLYALRQIVILGRFLYCVRAFYVVFWLKSVDGIWQRPTWDDDEEEAVAKLIAYMVTGFPNSWLETINSFGYLHLPIKHALVWTKPYRRRVDNDVGIIAQTHRWGASRANVC